MAEDALGDLTVASVREEDLVVEQIAALTDLTPRTVRKRLSEAHGKSLVRTIFADLWPTQADDLGDMHAKQAREAGLFVEIAALTGLSERVVRRRLEEAHGAGFLRRVFAESWPAEHAREADEPQQAEGDAPVVIGDVTVARARDDDDLIQRIAWVTGYEPRTVRRHMRGAHGASRVRNLFEDRWPVEPERLGGLRVKLVRECGLFPELSALLHMDEQSVRAWLEGCDGRMVVRNLFSAIWPATPSCNSEEEGEEDEDEDFDEDYEEEEDDDGDEDDDDEDEDDDGDQGDDYEDEGDAAARFRLNSDGSWSRPRTLSRVLRRLGMDVPQRLRGPRFRQALAQLAEVGIEMCLADDGDRGPLPVDADSPGVHARVRLRMAATDLPAPQPREHGAAKGRAARRAAAQHEALPTLRSAPPPPPIVVVTSPSHHAAPPPPAPRDAGYDMALRRLQFLTAVPSMGRQDEAEWPDAYLEAATAGLEVTLLEVKHLRMVAASFVKGHHSPSPILGRLVKGETPADLDLLLNRFLHLNRAMSEFAAEVVQWVQDQRGGQGHLAPTPMPMPTPAAPPPPQARAAAPPHAAPASSYAPSNTATNVRSLGALDDMFKE